MRFAISKIMRITKIVYSNRHYDNWYVRSVERNQFRTRQPRDRLNGKRTRANRIRMKWNESTREKKPRHVSKAVAATSAMDGKLMRQQSMMGAATFHNLEMTFCQGWWMAQGGTGFWDTHYCFVTVCDKCLLVPKCVLHYRQLVTICGEIITQQPQLWHRLTNTALSQKR